MGKNTHGGNGHKRLARKYATGQSNRLVISTDPLAVYAVATRILGNRMFHCLCTDGVERLGHIRGKFAGRGKSGNMVSINTWLLVGLREWTAESKAAVVGAAAAVASASASAHKMQECDLMEVYSHTDRPRLQTAQQHVPWGVLINADTSRVTIASANHADDDHIRFATEQDIARDDAEAMLKRALASSSSAAAMIHMPPRPPAAGEEDDEDDVGFNIADI